MIVCCGGNKIRAYDPEKGKVVWELSVKGQYNATPVADEEHLYLGSGGMFGQRPLLAIKAGASGDITLKQEETANDGVAWSIPQAGPPMASPLLYRGYLYVLDQNGGFLTCYDAKTGTPAYKRQRLQGAKGFTASPWAHDGKIYCLDQDGTTFVIEAGEQFKQLGKNTIEELFWSSPALADDALILRGVENLYCIQTKGAEK
jgi:outer membrane protein assembly factor BamB